MTASKLLAAAMALSLSAVVAVGTTLEAACPEVLSWCLPAPMDQAECLEEEAEASALLQAVPVLLEGETVLERWEVHGQNKYGHKSTHKGKCSRKVLILQEEGRLITYMQFSTALQLAGAEQPDLVELNSTDGGLELELSLAELKKYGLVYIKTASRDGPGGLNLTSSTGAKLKHYVDAGGALFLGDGAPKQANSFLEQLDSTIRMEKVDPDISNCSSPREAQIVPVRNQAKLLKGVRKLQGSFRNRLFDDANSSIRLFAQKTNPDVIVGRIEKKRFLVVVSDDDSVNDECYTESPSNLYSPQTNLRFFMNLFKSRCSRKRLCEKSAW